ncbi:uncharacterized protein MEPE_04773 [Melanopsichium pennsylvanicum]|uniref:Zn(2)-C6 fungal-type domain-containing protein n=2 Tax=Melanopsichium pennsylvanicum TaxID=63383 RepID=A0AAJ4XNA8_9BASI|nr:putative protein [Melanopsichium pennsylvanicum 4]SNX86064.1 uncharacterized protein MEPE_04773 [Melanopsichium pennsylvanicum]
MPSSPHPYRAPAHQLQHPEHASYSPSPRSTPLYSSTARKSHVYRSTPDVSSPETFNDHDRSRKGSCDHHTAAPSLPPPSSRLSAAFSDALQQPGPSEPKRSKQSHGVSLPASPSAVLSNKTSFSHVSLSDSTTPDSKPSSRVAKACQPCSTKKRRCDGRQPECSVCQVLGTPCTYNHTGLKRGPPKGFRSGPKESARAKLIRTLETTIRDLVNHLGKEDAGAEIVRVSGERDLHIAEAQPDAKATRTGTKAGSLQSSKAERDDLPSSRIKVEHLTGHQPSTSFQHAQRARDSDEDGDEKAAEAEEDVIGETRQGELVYRGSSSGIGILQRQHRAESPSGPVGFAANRSNTSSPSAPFNGRSRDTDAISHGKAPVFLPISSPRPIRDAETTSSQDRSPHLSKVTPGRDSQNVQSLYSGAKSDGHASSVRVSGEDPKITDEEHDRLFRYYWQGFHPFYPILYKPWFVNFSRQELRNNLEPGLLFAVYAIGACVVPGNAPPPSAIITESSLQKLNLERAASFCHAAECHVLAKGMRPDIASIQTCWLLSLYSHGTGDLSRAWNFSNLASSMAVDMGLHRWPIYRPEIVHDRVQRETRIRIIWHCYIIDKLLCAEMGRPVGLRAKDIDVPLLSETEDDEFELWSDQAEMHPNAQPRKMTSTSPSRRLHAPSCLNWGVHLFKIVERILDEVHSLRRKALLRRQGKEKVLADLDRQLTDWKTNLPAHLHLESSPSNDGPFPSFFALNLWYYTARLLLHRPFIPQEEGLPLSSVLANDSHRQSTLAANAICDLLEATSRDIVDRLSTDLGYCLFTAAVMFVFNARLGEEKVSRDARRRYGLCMQWLKKLADTWPAASAHRMLLDGFAVVGEDASKGTGADAKRRPSIAALQATTGMQATSKVSNWIAATEGALQEGAQDRMSDSGRNASPSRKQGRTSLRDPIHQRNDEAQTAASGALNHAQNGGDNLQPFSEAWNKSNAAFPANSSGMQNMSVSELTMDFAPGIFDVESFFWNENASASASNLMRMQYFSQLSNTNSMDLPPQQGQHGMSYNGFNSNMLTSYQMGGVQNSAQAPVQYGGGLGFNQHQRSITVPSNMQQSSMVRNSMAQPQQNLPMSQVGTEQNRSAAQPADAAATGAFNTSPFAFNPTNQSIGEFWSMLELPPAFLE